MDNVFWHMMRQTVPTTELYSQVQNFGYHVFHDWQVERTRPDALLCICLQGEPRFRHNGEWHSGGRGSVDLYLPWEEQQYECGGVWESFWFHFHPSPVLLEILQHNGITGGTFWPNAIGDQSLSNMERIFTYAQLPEHLAYHRAAVDMEKIIFDCLVENADRVVKPQKIRLRDIGSYIRLNPGEQYSVSVLAERAGLSPSRFAHLFKEEYSVPVGAYIIKVRMESAAHLLQSTKMTAAEIGYRLGYKSPFHFYSTFLKTTGQTPKTYRRKQVVL